MKKEELYSHFKAVALSQPDLSRYLEFRSECDQWLARAFALVELEGDPYRVVGFRNILNRFNVATLADKKSEIQIISSMILQCLAKLELSVAPDAQGSFIHVGQSLDAYKALTQIFARAKQSLLIVDPYMDGSLVTDFLIGVDSNVSILLLSDKSTYKPDLIVASKKWRTQFQGSRPIELKLADDRTLHDRLIVVDNSVVWTVTQSFKDFAKRSPASVLKVDEDTAALKIQAYETVWNQSTSPL
jgi:hypothetical protein